MVPKRLPLLIYLARSELQRRYAGSALGMVWAVLAPIALVGTVWLAIDFGLGMRARLGPGFGIALIVGMIGWLAFADSISDATTAIVRNPHLVKKVVFPVELVPLASVAAAFAVHSILLAILAIVLALLGHLDLHFIWTLPIWVLLSAALSSGIALIVSSLNVSLRDVQAIAPFMTSLWFWLTPVIWMPTHLPGEWRWVVGLNPMAVVVEGYRTALLGSPFPFDLVGTGIACLAIALLCVVGNLLFTTLRPSFADTI